MRFHSISRVIGAALLAGMLVAGMASSALAKGPHFNEKFEFEPVTFSDGSTGTIYAGSKLNNNGDQFTQCTYVGQNHEFLGAFGTARFSSPDARTVLRFCLAHFEDRS